MGGRRTGSITLSRPDLSAALAVPDPARWFSPRTATAFVYSCGLPITCLSDCGQGDIERAAPLVADPLVTPSDGGFAQPKPFRGRYTPFQTVLAVTRNLDPRTLFVGPDSRLLTRAKTVARVAGDQSMVRSRAQHFNLLTHSVIESLPVFSAARAIPDLPTLIFSAYCNGIRGDFHPPAWVMAARSMSRAARS
jgi:hypothetical protein